ncbi:hypothetical protein PR202_gb09403 [Eleusine coracana subsp. coracana]|uniref:FLZ-type domain-containing protein n=1 Tax=Eleusine coracana subsp. coracana TaxID=191504 RepID=A0AAV5EH40_ELECO|nr:hypothetical protein QOZ80_2BG0196920 [Eleusine coracana subsp. coracana]GJN21881.1 hypothetical protein PR202_gb09403 [Eleusine coracana subsp. coracana]
MEDYHYFPSSLEAPEHIGAGFYNLTSSPPPKPRRASRDDDNAGVLHHHYLDACFLCGRLLGGNKDIFMYRGDTPFCSEECRQQQIETDEAREKKSKRSPARKEQRQRQSCSPRRIPVWAR